MMFVMVADFWVAPGLRLRLGWCCLIVVCFGHLVLGYSGFGVLSVACQLGLVVCV